MAQGRIESGKLLAGDIFGHMWFRIPEYQRPYVWEDEEVGELLEDLSGAMEARPDSEYFLGSLVFQTRAADARNGRHYSDNDLLDGQQRMTTILLLLAVIRDLSDDPLAKDACQKGIYQKADPYRSVPERTRLSYAIREDVQEFIDRFVKDEGGTSCTDEIAKIAAKSENRSIRNMASAIAQMRRFFPERALKPETLLDFLLKRVLMVFVSAEDLEDAFRLFVVLNDRGVPLRNSDILKSMNLGALGNEVEKDRYARLWEEIEQEFGEGFDRFLSYLRAILVKDRIRLTLLREFEDKVYDPKERDKVTGQQKAPLLRKGKATFEFVHEYHEHHRQLFSGDNHSSIGSFAFDNLLRLMSTGLPGTDWVPPLLRYFDRFEFEGILRFLKALDNKFSADWIGQYSPNDRIAAMNRLIEVIEEVSLCNEVLESSALIVDGEALLRAISGPVYGRRFARYVLLRLDYAYQNHDNRMQFESLSVEHVLPQDPEEHSEWVQLFGPDERALWTDRLGNLILITRRKNSSLGRLDYREKKRKYFARSIDPFPNSQRVLASFESWGLDELTRNHSEVTSKLSRSYGLAT